MGENTKIDWATHSFNGWWGCTKVSEACENCYAAALAKRCGFDCFGPGKPRRTFGPKHWNEPFKWDAKAKKLGVKHKVFAGSMCDLFDPEGPEGARNALLGMTLCTPNLIWILCTKRPQNIPSMVPSLWMSQGWPENIWLLVTGENQKRMDERIPLILPIPVSVHGVSLEPMLGPVDIFTSLLKVGRLNIGEGEPFDARGIDWLIIGTESGPGRRPANLKEVRSLVEQGRVARVPVFIKQLEINEKTSKDPNEWPEDLRIREFPEGR